LNIDNKISLLPLLWCYISEPCTFT